LPVLRRQALTIDMPEALQEEKAQPCQHAWVVKIPMQPSQLQLPL
jgi:hypothetical protein